MFDSLYSAIFHELELLDNKLQGGKAPMNSQDLENIDKMAHALKCLATYEAMKEREGYTKERARSKYEEYHRY